MNEDDDILRILLCLVIALVLLLAYIAWRVL